MLHNNVVDAN